MDKLLIEQARKAISSGRKKERVLDVSEAFKKYPVENEIHEGKLECFQNMYDISDKNNIGKRK